jgi:uracil-DNA glycosylase family 4
MTLQLDARRIAMLEEMGIRGIVLPRVAPAAGEPAPVAERAVERAAERAPAPVRQQPAAPAVRPAAAPRMQPATQDGRAPQPSHDVSHLESLDWQGLQAAVADGTACAGGQRPVFGAGDAPADWMVVGDPPGAAECDEGRPFAGESAVLLENMLAAVGLRRGKGVFITNVLKCPPPDNRNPGPPELAQAAPLLRRQVALVQPRVILAMGRFAVQALLQTTEPIGKLRGRVHDYNGVPVVVTYPPAYLLRNLPDKAKAWADLCLAQAIVTGA